MKTSNILCGALAIVMTITTSCVKKTDYSKFKQEDKEIVIDKKFDKISAFSTTDIEYVQGPAKITLTAPEKVIDEIEVYVEGNTLKVGKKDFHEVKGSFHSKLTISYPYVNTFESSGTADITIKGIDVKDLTIDSFGTGDISVQSAKCVKFSAKSTGTGDIDVSHLSCVVAELMTSGTGDIDINRISADKISGNSSGTGDIKISGECVDALLSASGTGKINDSRLERRTADEEN